MKGKQPALFRKSPNIILVGILFGLFYWIVDAIIEVFLFYKGTLVENLATPDSDQIWMRSFILFMFIVFSVTIQRVLNKRKSAEEALKESEERYRRLAGASSEGIVIHDGTRIIDVNQIFVDASGYELHELLEMSPLECLADESREKAAAYIRDGHEEPYEAVAQRKNGSTFPVEINARTVPHDGRQVRVAAVKDISERKKARAEQHDIDGNYKTLFNSGNDPVLVFSLSDDGRPGISGKLMR